MRVYPVSLLVAMLVSALLSWGFCSLDANLLKDAIRIGSFVFFASTLACAIGMDYADRRLGVSVKLVGWISFMIALLLNLLFAFTSFSQTSYVVVCGIAYLLFVLAANGVFNAAQS